MTNIHQFFDDLADELQKNNRVIYTSNFKSKLEHQIILPFHYNHYISVTSRMSHKCSTKIDIHLVIVKMIEPYLSAGNFEHVSIRVVPGTLSQSEITDLVGWFSDYIYILFRGVD